MKHTFPPVGLLLRIMSKTSAWAYNITQSARVPDWLTASLQAYPFGISTVNNKERHVLTCPPSLRFLFNFVFQIFFDENPIRYS